MRVLLVADPKSVHTQNWVSNLRGIGAAVLLADYRRRTIITFEGAGRAQRPKDTTWRADAVIPRQLLARQVDRLGPGGRLAAKFTLAKASQAWLRRAVEALAPDIIHSMRIPVESMATLRAASNSVAPWVVSVWGNDLVYWAENHSFIRGSTKEVLRRCSALHVDCERDLHAARRWGLASETPSVKLPGGGGVDLSSFFPLEAEQRAEARHREFGAHVKHVVLNPRGIRPYVNSKAYIEATLLLAPRFPDTVFLGAGLAESWDLARRVERSGMGDQVQLLGDLPPTELARYMRMADLAVSPSIVDGTPNTLLEAMAAAVLPVSGDIETVREWVTHGTNGLLFDPNDPLGMATAIARGLTDEALRLRAGRFNRDLVAPHTRQAAAVAMLQLYEQLTAGKARTSPVGSTEG